MVRAGPARREELLAPGRVLERAFDGAQDLEAGVQLVLGLTSVQGAISELVCSTISQAAAW